MQELTMQHVIARLPGVHIAHAPLEGPPHGVEHRLDVPADEHHCYTGQQPAQGAHVGAGEAIGWTVEAQQGPVTVGGQRRAARGQPRGCHIPACKASHCRPSPVQASTLKSPLVSSSGLPAALMPARSTCSTVPPGRQPWCRQAHSPSISARGGQPPCKHSSHARRRQSTDGLSHQQQ